MGWGHRTTLKESIYWEGGHRTYFVGVGTPHNIYRKSLAVGGWVGAGWSKLENNATLWLHLASWNLPDSQLSWESKMEPSVAMFQDVQEISETVPSIICVNSPVGGMIT